MTGLTFADAEVFDLSATSGSHTFHPVNPANLVVHASQNSETSSFQPSAALDHNRDTAWETGVVVSGTTVVPTSLTVRKPDSSSITVVSYTLSTRNGWSGRAPKSFELRGSNDGTTWTSVDSRTNITSWSDGAGGVKTFTLSTPATFVYWRLIVTATQTTGQILNLGELYFNDLENNDPPPQPVYYVRLTNIPRGRVVTVDIPSNMLTSYGSGGDIGWQALTTQYAETYYETTGTYDPYGTAQFFYGPGDDIVLRVWIESYADLTLNWTSVESPTPLQPNTWFDRQVITGVSGSVTYNGTRYEASKEPRRFYSLTPTSSDPLTITTNEPNSYFEVYAETGVSTFDEYLEDGENNASGVSTNACVITPTPGQEYVIVVYPGYQPTETTTYAMAWSQEAFSAPYVVSNDMLINALDLGKATTGLTHAYDNTGATADPEVSWAKRSIWYRFHVDEASFAKITFTPSSADPGMDPYGYLFTSDGTLTGSSIANGSPLYANTPLVPGAEYYLMIDFSESTPTSDWEQAGSMAFEVKLAPAHTTDPNFTLPPGDASPGGGQNYHVGPLWPGTGVGASGVMKIVAPSDGGLSIIVEAGNEGGTFLAPWVKVELPYSSETGALLPDNTWATNIVALDTGLGDPLHPLQMPWRNAGATAPDPVTLSVKAGDVITVRVLTAQSGVYVRWGMTTTTTAASDWVSARYGDYATHDGTVVPSGATADEAAAIQANAVAWPIEGDLELGQRPNDLPQYYDDIVKNPMRRQTRWDFVDNQRSLSSAGDEIDYGGILNMLDASAHGGNYSTVSGYGGPYRQTDDWPGQDNLINNMGGRVMFDPATAKTITEMGTTLRLSRQQAYALHDKRFEAKVNDGSDTWYPLSATNARTKGVLSGMRPVVARAEQGLLESVRPWYDPATPGFATFDDAGSLVRMLTWKVEWSSGEVGPVKDVFNLYRWTHAVIVTRSVRDPYASQTLPFNQIESNPDYPASSPWPTRDVDLTVRIYSVEVEVTDDAWVPPEIVASGELVDEFDFPSQSVIESPPVLTMNETKDRDIGFGVYAFEDALYEADVFGGTRPGVGEKLYDNVYGMLMAPYEVGHFPWETTIGAYWDVRGYINGPPDQFTVGSFFFHWDTSAAMRTMAARRYPDQFRVSLWVPSLAAIASVTPPTPQPGAGYYVLPNPNLDGQGDGVDVHFASAT